MFTSIRIRGFTKMRGGVCSGVFTPIFYFFLKLLVRKKCEARRSSYDRFFLRLSIHNAMTLIIATYPRMLETINSIGINSGVDP